MSSISMYQASAPRFTQSLNSLSVILTKGHEFAKAKKIDPTVLMQARLYPDMLPLARQVQIASDNAKGCIARLAGVEVPRYEDTEQNFDDLQARVARTSAFIATVSSSMIDGTEDKDIVLKLGPREVQFKGLQYLCGFALPNFYFHVTTAYAILRHNGVDLNKSEYIGTP